MENKDWREQVKKEWAEYNNGVFASLNTTLDFMSKILKSKQEEIEKEMDKMKKVHKFKVTEVEDIVKESYNQALDDLKPIISNLLK